MVMQVPLQGGSQVKLYQTLHAALYEAVFNILDSTSVILPLCDSLRSAAGATACTTMGAEQVDFTWSTGGADNSWSTFDGHDDIGDSDTFPYRYQGIIPFVDFNGTDEEADSPDAAYWTRDDAGSTEKLSIGAWINPDNVSGVKTILAKYDATTSSELREWFFFLNGDKLTMNLWDESANAAIGRRDNTSPSMVAGQWQFVVVTYSGSAANSGIKVYRNGVQIDDGDDSTGSYTGMENLGTIVTLAHHTGASALPDGFFGGKMAGGPLGPFFTQVELSPNQVLRLFELGRRVLAL